MGLVLTRRPRSDLRRSLAYATPLSIRTHSIIFRGLGSLSAPDDSGAGLIGETQSSGEASQLGEHRLDGDAAAGHQLTARNIVLQKSVIFGSVNANRNHYELAAEALAQADPGWLADLITRQVPLDQWNDAYTRRPDDIKTILGFPDGSL